MELFGKVAECLEVAWLEKMGEADTAWVSVKGLLTLTLLPVHFLIPNCRCGMISQPLVSGSHAFQTMMREFFDALNLLQLRAKISLSFFKLLLVLYFV